jgi:GH15 family glucan-1,4-alpha-glucosidase
MARLADALDCRLAVADQIMYGISGERRLPEWEVPWLAGYEGSRPVRIGNAAADQRQLDVFGQVADVLYQGVQAGLPRHPRAACD